MEQNFDNTKITVEFDEAGNRQQLSSGDSLKILFGKIKKWFYDLKPVAFSGDYNDLENRPTIMKSASSLSNGDIGLVPAPSKKQLRHVLIGNGIWEHPCINYVIKGYSHYEIHQLIPIMFTYPIDGTYNFNIEYQKQFTFQNIYDSVIELYIQNNFSEDEIINPTLQYINTIQIISATCSTNSNWGAAGGGGGTPSIFEIDDSINGFIQGNYRDNSKEINIHFMNSQGGGTYKLILFGIAYLGAVRFEV